MREAGVVSLNIRMVRECYQMMDLMEKQDFVFTQEDKRILLGYAFHQQDLDCVHDAVIHIAAVREKEKSQGNLEAGIIEQYAIRGGSELQERIKEYIIQLEVANINQEIANQLLVKILQDKNVDYELDRMLEELRKREDEKKKENEAIYIIRAKRILSHFPGPPDDADIIRYACRTNYSFRFCHHHRSKECKSSCAGFLKRCIHPANHRQTGCQ